jgi:cell division protease FtsH
VEERSSVAAALGGALVGASGADVGVARERARLRRLRNLALLLGIPTAFLWYRILDGRPLNLLAGPGMPEDPILYVIPVIFVLAILVLVGIPLASGRPPHLLSLPP